MSIVQIAKLAGVSHMTVSRVINNDSTVSPETAKKVRQVMKEVGYVPKPPSLRRGPRRTKDVGFKTGNVAFLTSSSSLRVLSTSPVMLDVVRGVEEALAAYGMSMVQGAISEGRQLPPIVARGEVDGVIVWPNLDGVSEETIEILHNYKIVYVMTALEDRLPGDRVQNNNRQIGRIAAKYLLSKGHKRIGYIAPSALALQQNMCQRWQSFSEVVEQFQSQARQLVIEQSAHDLLEINFDRDQVIRRALAELFESDQAPTGFFVTCDALTAKLYPILCSLGVRIGMDVEILSCDNQASLLAGLEPKPLSIDIQPELIGKTAVERLRWRIMHPEDDGLHTIEIQPRLSG
ncbi:MAG TPA: LacI family DNA-binding transcriptional regulator [Anaerohalosphaeraceae bacterium]|nr:LacI family DNA-binding transcriptional regulator [Anaerohalosphaeraceae bacterium]HRS71352.1 LacI family DNA-binding transcriptional regulator [Anaerohalosphaeraceae bacterium]